MEDEKEAPGVAYAPGWGHDLLAFLDATPRVSLTALRVGIYFRISHETRATGCLHHHLHLALDGTLPIGVVPPIMFAGYIVALALGRVGWANRGASFELGPDFGSVLANAHADLVEEARRFDESTGDQLASEAIPQIVKGVMTGLLHGQAISIAVTAFRVPDDAPRDEVN